MTFLPPEIADEIISVLAQDDPFFSSTKACALVCHEFHHLCRKYIFASINLNQTLSPSPTSITKATTRMLQRLLDTTPEIADHIRNLSYNITSDDLEKGSLVETFQKITRLKNFCICHFDLWFRWNDSPLRPALLHLLHLPTLTHFGMLFINNFLVTDLAPCINLKELNFVYLTVFDDDTLASNPPQKSIRLRNVSAGLNSAVAINTMCAVHCADGKPFIDFSYINNLTIKLYEPSEIQASLDLLSRCDHLTSVTVDLQVWNSDSVMDLTSISFAKMLYPAMQALKHFHLNILFEENSGSDDPLAGLCNELEKMRAKNVIETIMIDVEFESGPDCGWGDEWGCLDVVLAQPGWPNLQQVSLGIVFWSKERIDNGLEQTLKTFPRMQFPKLLSSQTLLFEFSIRKEYF